MRAVLVQTDVVVDTAVAEPAWAVWVAWGVVPMAAGLLGLLAATGVLSQRRLTASPRRDVGLTWMDLLVGLWLWAMGLVLAGAVTTGLAGRSPADDLESVEIALPSAWAMVLGQLCIFGPPIAWWLWRSSRTPGWPGVLGLWARPGWRGTAAVVLGFPAVVLLFLATQQVMAVLMLLLGHEPPRVQHELLEAYAALRDRGDWAVMLGLLGSTVVVAPLLEELFFRGFLQTTLVNAAGPSWRWPMLLGVGVFFASVHLGAVPAMALPALWLLGVCFGWLYERTGSLWPAIGVHAGFNAINVAYVLAVV